MVTRYASPAYTPRRSPSTFAIRGHSIYRMLDHFPIACFTLTLLTDLAYQQSSNLMWKQFSEWLLLAGLVFGGLELLALLIDVIFSRPLRASGLSGAYLLAMVLVLALATANSFVHAIDGWLGVVPWGVTLSAVTFLAVLITAWIGREMEFRSERGMVQ